MIPILLAMALLNSTKALSQLDSRQKTDSVKNLLSFRILPQNFYTTHLAYTCKKEIQLQKFTGLPIFIRLGSKDHVDYLENKYAHVQISGYTNANEVNPNIRRY